jgi:hypothetical protein
MKTAREAAHEVMSAANVPWGCTTPLRGKGSQRMHVLGCDRMTEALEAERRDAIEACAQAVEQWFVPSTAGGSMTGKSIASEYAARIRSLRDTRGKR